MNALTIHNGLEYIKARKKMSVLQDVSHSENEKITSYNKLILTFIFSERNLRLRLLEYRRWMALFWYSSNITEDFRPAGY